MVEQDYEDDVIQTLEDSQLSEADKIRALHTKGFSRKQLIDEFAFPKTSVYRVLPVHPEKGKDEAKEGWNDGLPVVRKVGGGMEVVNPEVVLRRYTDGSADDEIELRGMMKLRAAMLMVMDLVNILKGEAEADARRVEPILKLMKETREEQDAAAMRAKASSMDIAQEAAEGVASRIVAHLDRKKPDIATTQDPMKGFMARAAETIWDRMVGVMFGGAQGGQANLPPEWQDLRK